MAMPRYHYAWALFFLGLFRNTNTKNRWQSCFSGSFLSSRWNELFCSCQQNELNKQKEVYSEYKEYTSEKVQAGNCVHPAKFMTWHWKPQETGLRGQSRPPCVLSSSNFQEYSIFRVSINFLGKPYTTYSLFPKPE